ncbi:MAG: phosphoribosylanthranilate isomerase, partial [Zetaproteobacteria bacterium]|nr:phosphoribosylanthranilate isomerase [Zetaproteobacteria bacterium]
EQVKIPVFLAGGINASNALKAIKHVKPYGLDLCSGVRTQTKLDAKKLRLFFQTINN